MLCSKIKHRVVVASTTPSYSAKMGLIVSAIETQQPGDEAARSSSPDSNDEDYVRQGRSCCGCLCDMRRCVVIMSGVGILIQAAGIGLNFWRIDQAKQDTTTAGELDQLDDLFTALVIIASFGITALLVAMAGGILFNKYMVVLNAVYLPISVVASIVLSFNVQNDVIAFDYGVTDFIGQLIGMIFAEYAYISFYWEVSAGILTKETYPKEEQSCCCV